MAQKIKVQDGNIVYAASDPSIDVNFDINGLLHVTKELLVGDDLNTTGTITTGTITTGTITTAPGQNLTITTGIDGNIILSPTPTGSLIMNGITWPSPGSITQGQYLGASGFNTLEFYPFIFASAGSDALTMPQLNIFYPAIQPGQCVVGPTVVYQCIGINEWRILQPRLDFTPVDKAGDTMTGDLILNSDPTIALGAATKQYVDSAIVSGVSTPATQVVYGTGSGIISDTTFTYDSGTNILSVGTTGPALIEANVGQQITISGDGGAELKSNTNTFGINSTGTMLINNSAGTIGQVLTSAGPGAPAVWGTGIPSSNIIINTQSGDYMLQITDAFNTLIRITKATPATVTIPNDSTVNLPIGSAVLISWNGLGQVTIGFEIGVTVDTPNTYIIGKQFGKITAIKTDANHWEIEGNLVPI